MGGHSHLGDLATAPPPGLLTTLPATPGNGQEIYYDTGTGLIWHLRYNAALAGAYKWQFLGGNCLYASVEAQRGPKVVGPGLPLTWLGMEGPKITLPRPGLYDIQTETGVWASIERAVIYQGVNGVIADTDPVQQKELWRHLFGSIQMELAAQTLEQQFYSEAELTFYVNKSRLRATPVRIG